jgi:hypothetical protein
VEVFGRARAGVFWPLRLAGLGAYAVIAATGHASIAAILWCESLTVAGVLALWIGAAVRRHPLARPMLVAIGASVAAATFRLVPGAAGLLGLDPDSAYHLAQIVGIVLLFHAVAGGRTSAVSRPAGPRSA